MRKARLANLVTISAVHRARLPTALSDPPGAGARGPSAHRAPHTPGTSWTSWAAGWTVPHEREVQSLGAGGTAVGGTAVGGNGVARPRKAVAKGGLQVGATSPGTCESEGRSWAPSWMGGGGLEVQACAGRQTGFQSGPATREFCDPRKGLRFFDSVSMKKKIFLRDLIGSLGGLNEITPVNHRPGG